MGTHTALYKLGYKLHQESICAPSHDCVRTTLGILRPQWAPAGYKTAEGSWEYLPLAAVAQKPPAQLPLPLLRDAQNTALHISLVLQCTLARFQAKCKLHSVSAVAQCLQDALLIFPFLFAVLSDFWLGVLFFWRLCSMENMYLTETGIP